MFKVAKQESIGFEEWTLEWEYYIFDLKLSDYLVAQHWLLSIDCICIAVGLSLSLHPCIYLNVCSYHYFGFALSSIFPCLIALCVIIITYTQFYLPEITAGLNKPVRALMHVLWSSAVETQGTRVILQAILVVLWWQAILWLQNATQWHCRAGAIGTAGTAIAMALPVFVWKNGGWYSGGYRSASNRYHMRSSTCKTIGMFGLRYSSTLIDVCIGIKGVIIKANVLISWKRDRCSHYTKNFFSCVSDFTVCLFLISPVISLLILLQ